MSKRTSAGIFALLLCVILATITLQLLSPPTTLPANADDRLFSAERALAQLKMVAKEPHSVGTEANQEVINYLVKELEQIGLTVSIQDTLVAKYATRNNGVQLSKVKNIVGRLKGTDPSKAVMLMAHHDSQPNTPGAADDGYGVVSILESLRAAKANGPLKNDVMVLITDAEEIGLMGAKGFVDYHPALTDVGILLNVEARGNAGVSISFEINPENGWIIRQFAQAAPYPISNSMGYEVYKILPNDTDFSEFRKTNIAGVNSANIEGFVNYHSMTDTPENGNKNTLQHHGSNMLGMLLHFGNLGISATKAPDATFFNPIGYWLVVYPNSYDVGFMILTVLLFLGTVIFGIQKQQVILSHLLLGTGYFLVILVLSGIGSYVLQQTILSLYPHYTSFYANNFYNVAYYFFSFIGLSSLFFAVLFGFQPELNGLSISLGGALMLVMAMFGMTISLPTATYLLYYPLIIFFTVQYILLFFNINAKNAPWQYGIGQFLALSPAITLWTQTIYLLFMTFGLTEAIIVPVLFYSFLGFLAIPIIRMISLGKKSILNILAIIVLLGGFMAGHFSSDISKTQPLQTYLIYGYDVDNNQAVWANIKPYQDEWIKNYIPAGTVGTLDEIYPDLNWKSWRSDAPVMEVQPTQIQLIKDTIVADNQRDILLFVKSPVFKNSLEIFLEDGTAISNLMVNDLPISAKPSQRNQSIYLNFYAPPIAGFYLKMTTSNEVQKLRIVDRTIGLPTTLLKIPLPENRIHGPGDKSNVVLLKKSWAF